MANFLSSKYPAELNHQTNESFDRWTGETSYKKNMISTHYSLVVSFNSSIFNWKYHLHIRLFQ